MHEYLMMGEHHRVEYDYNSKDKCFEKSKTQIGAVVSKKRNFPIRCELQQIEITNKHSGLRIAGKKSNGQSPTYAPAYPLKSDPAFYVSKVLELLKGKEIVYLCVFHPYLLKIDTKLTVYYFERVELGGIVEWQGLTKSFIHQIAADFIKSLKLNQP